MNLLPRMFACLIALSAALAGAQKVAHTLTYAPGKSITLELPAAFDIDIVATGLSRVRFFAKSPDGRFFATTMHDLGDNSLGTVVILESYNAQERRFERVTTYLKRLRNPNSIAFYTDSDRQSWLYVALTDKVVRYKYAAGDNAPRSAAETLIRFPACGLGYKYGGWHLTRTLQFAPVNGKTRLFVSVGSSCNYCQEHEVARASILVMDPDGKNAAVLARGVRNAVGLGYFSDVDAASLFATNMGADHLGDQLPDDPLLAIHLTPAMPVNFGWPACYYANGMPKRDVTPLPRLEDLASNGKLGKAPAGADDSVYGTQKGVAQAGSNLAAGGGRAPAVDPNATLGKPPTPLANCTPVPRAYATFAAHSSPLGIEHFPATDPALSNSFLVALHGAGHPRIGTGYRVARFTEADRRPQDFITGFLTVENGKPLVHGRPCGILRVDRDSFLLSDDYLGLVYFIHPRK
jgi:glucose/arabinose dehydrogenase